MHSGKNFFRVNYDLQGLGRNRVKLFLKQYTQCLCHKYCKAYLPRFSDFFFVKQNTSTSGDFLTKYFAALNCARSLLKNYPFNGVKQMLDLEDFTLPGRWDILNVNFELLKNDIVRKSATY